MALFKSHTKDQFYTAAFKYRMKRSILIIGFGNDVTQTTTQKVRDLALWLIGIIVPMGVAFFGGAFTEQGIPFLPGLTEENIKLWTILFLIIVVICYLYWFRGKIFNRIEEYKPADYYFQGLYSSRELITEKEKRDNVINREKEIDFLTKRLYQISKNNNSLLLLSGKSGDGKSTILRFIQSNSLKKDSRYKVYLVNQYVDKYDNERKLKYETVVENAGELRIEEKEISFEGAIKELSDRKNYDKPIYIIFDQFEDLLLLKEDGGLADFKKDFFNKLAGIDNIALLFCIREEYTSQFLGEFNFALKEQNPIDAAGQISAFKIDNFSGSDMIVAHPWLLSLKRGFKKEELDTQEEKNPEDKQEKTLEAMKRNCFKKANKDVKELVELITDEGGSVAETQLLLYFLEREYWENELEGVLSLHDKNNGLNRERLLHLFFDRLLCKTDRYYEAMQIMYLLSFCVGKSITLTVGDIKKALCFPECEKIVNTVIAMLIHDKLVIVPELNKESGSNKSDESTYDNIFQTIAESKRNILRVKVIHDFIGERFLPFAAANLPSEVKQSLDHYCENIQKFRAIKNKTSKKREHEAFVSPMIAAGAAAIVVVWNIISFRGLVSDLFNELSWFTWTMIIIVFCLAYTYNWCLYFNAIRIHLDENRRTAVGFLMFCVPLIVSWLFLYFLQYQNVWVFSIFGIAIILSGLGIVISVAGSNLTKQARKFIYGVGRRIMVGGILITFCAFVFWSMAQFIVLDPFDWWNIQLTVFLFIMFIITIYGIPSHLNNEYYMRIIGAFNCREFTKTESG